MESGLHIYVTSDSVAIVMYQQNIDEVDIGTPANVVIRRNDNGITEVSIDLV